MKANKKCNGSECNGRANEFRHPPLCKDPAHMGLTRQERPEGCVLWHTWKETQNMNRGTRSYNVSNGRWNKSGGNSNKALSGGHPRGVSNSSNSNYGKNALAKENERLRKTTANQQIEIAKANARHKAFKQVTASQSYSGMTVPALRVEDRFPALDSRPRQLGLPAAAAAPLNLEAVLMHMTALMEVQEKKLEILISLTR
jgi:hypothetical protein